MIVRFAALPLELRLLLVFLLSTIVAGQLNRGIYRLAWHQRDVGPWSQAARGAPARHWPDFLPVVGWFFLRREVSIHGSLYWLRPLLVELLFSIGIASLYWWETSRLLPWQATATGSVLHLQFLAHFVLIALMVVATFIDIDEKTIPDAITIPGTLLGLLIAAILPQSQLSIIALETNDTPIVLNLILTSPAPWSEDLDGSFGLWLGIVCFIAWCYALLPKIWWTRSGPIKALRYLIASIGRNPVTKWIGGLAVLGCLVIVFFWRNGGPEWQASLSSLVGLAFGGGLVWAVRFVAGWALRKEAMGFGDVTLMAMIGSFVGWQPALIIFFLAPLAGMAIAISQWLLTRQPEIAYGPFLCAATLLLVVFWASIWDHWGLDIFGLGLFVPILVAICLLLMAVLLFAWRRITSLFYA